MINSVDICGSAASQHPTIITSKSCLSTYSSNTTWCSSPACSATALSRLCSLRRGAGLSVARRPSRARGCGSCLVPRCCLAFSPGSSSDCGSPDAKKRCITPNLLCMEGHSKSGRNIQRHTCKTCYVKQAKELVENKFLTRWDISVIIVPTLLPRLGLLVFEFFCDSPPD